MSELKTCFNRVDYDLDGLLHFIDLGDIALPDIQRPGALCGPVVSEVSFAGAVSHAAPSAHLTFGAAS